jgi:formyltetrahydrofolate-dependent phosphoribosylglycinamide formyltransferase
VDAAKGKPVSIQKAIIHTDGGSRGNPGPGAAGYTIDDPAGKRLAARGVFLGKVTNNYAEYTAVGKALRHALELGVKEVQLYSDSDLLVQQLNGRYKVKSENIRPLYERCLQILEDFDAWRITHIRREKNADADALANKAMDAKADVDCTPAAPQPTGKKLRLGILLSGGGRTMVNLQQQIDAGRLNAEIVTVISSRSVVAGNDRARELGLEPMILRRKECSDVESFSDRIAEVLDAAKVDLVIQAGWLCLWHIPPQYENRVMNIHPALLPAFGGQGMWGHHVHEAVLKAGCKVSGCTVHFCTNEYDAGPIIVQRTCPVLDDDTPDTLAARVFEQESLAYPEAIALFSQDRLTVKNNIVRRQ